MDVTQDSNYKQYIDNNVRNPGNIGKSQFAKVADTGDELATHELRGFGGDNDQ